MKPEIRIILFLFILLVITPVFCLNTALDVALVPRFLCLSITLILSVFLFWRKISQAKIERLRWFDACFLLWYLLAGASLLWAFNFGEGIFAVQRIFTAFVVYLLLRFLLSEYGKKALRIMLICNIGLTILVLGSVFWQMIDSPNIFRLIDREFRAITGFSAQRNLLCSFLFLTLIFNVLFVRQLKQQRWRMACFGLIAVQIFIILLFQTRAVYVALTVASSFFILGSQQIISFFNIKRIIGLAVVAVVLLSMVRAGYYFYGDDFGVYLENFDVREYAGSKNARQRIKIWEKTALLIQEKPLTGVGVGSWEIFFPKNGLEDVLSPNRNKVVSIQRPHNDFLWVFSETGILGFLAYVGMFLTTFFVGFKSLKNADKDIRVNIWILLSGLLGYLVIANLSFPLERIEHQLWLMLLFSVLFFYGKNDGQYSFKLPFKMDTRVLLFLILAGLSLNLTLSYYRHRGEKSMRIVYLDSTSDEEKKRLLAQAQSPFYTLDHVGYPVSWYSGVLANKLGNSAQAHEHFTEAYQMNPYNYKVLSDLASINGQLKNFDVAKRYLLEAYKVDSNSQVVMFNLAVLYHKLKDRETAIEWANKLPDTYPHKRGLLEQLGVE